MRSKWSNDVQLDSITKLISLRYRFDIVPAIHFSLDLSQVNLGSYSHGVAEMTMVKYKLDFTVKK